MFNDVYDGNEPDQKKVRSCAIQLNAIARATCADAAMYNMTHKTGKAAPKYVR